MRRFSVNPSPVFWLLAGQLVMFTGIAALFPIAPLYIAHRGGNSVAIAIFVAGPLAANMLAQVPAGRLADRIGRRPLLIGTRVAYAALAALLFFDVGPLWLLITVRALQGATSGAYVPALMAALTDMSEPHRRAERFSQQQAVEMVGLLVGPLLGGAAALWRDSGAFGVAGLAVLIGLLPMARVPETKPRGPRPQQAPHFRWRQRGIVVPALGLLVVGTVFSMYDVVWPQYLTARGYGAFVIGVSISLFAIPILLLARRAGRLSDRVDRRKLIPTGFTVVACCAASYPFMRSLLPIQLVGEAEAVATVVLEPSLFAVIGESVDEHNRGRAMGIGGFFQFGGSAFGAGVLGALYGVNGGAPFWSSSGLLVSAAVLCAVALPLRRARVPGPPLEPQPTVREREAV
ncbi:MAG: MFS transporter [Candidatus Dormibacteria bacterium]